MTNKVRFGLWTIVCAVLALVVAFLIVSGKTVRGEVCAAKPDYEIAKRAGYRWQYRLVDGRQCWYYSNRIIPAVDLVWAFTEEEFNRDIDRIIERKFYLDKHGNILLGD